ncbi:MAG TPA: sugar-binding protein [Blastocatellia bacterium]|nr:sugar-binding protein [Blastocatellia bacterium]
MKLSNKILSCFCVLASLLSFSCSPKEGPTSGASKFKVAFITNNASDFWTIARKGCEKADQELADVEVEFKIPPAPTAAEQRRIVDDLMAKGVSGIAISPVDPTNQTPMINEISKQILVVTQDSDAPQSNRACYLGTDNVAAGRQAGDLIKEALPQGGKIMLFVGQSDARNAQERYQGIKESLAGSKVEIIDLRTDDADRVRAKANVLDTLVKYSDVACLVGLWSYNGPAIINALKDAGKIGQIKVVCFDEEDETLAGVKDGSIYATVVQQPYEFGYQSVHMLAKVLSGDRSTIPASKQQIVPTLVIKRDGVEEFTAKINRLRGRS